MSAGRTGSRPPTVRSAARRPPRGPRAAPAPRIACPQVAPHAPTGATVEAALQAFRVADRQLGGGHLYATVVRYLQVEVGPRLFGSVRDESGPAVFRAAAALTDLAGWMAHDAGRDGLTEQHFVRALDLAKAGGGGELEGQILASMSHLALQLGRPAAAVGLAQAGRVAIGRGPRRAALEARLCAMEAHGQAAWRESGACDRLLGQAEHLLAGAATPPPDWVSPFDAGSLAGEAARCRLGVERALLPGQVVDERQGGDPPRRQGDGQRPLGGGDVPARPEGVRAGPPVAAQGVPHRPGGRGGARRRLTCAWRRSPGSSAWPSSPPRRRSRRPPPAPPSAGRSSSPRPRPRPGWVARGSR